jgi:hypothetical protein
MADSYLERVAGEIADITLADQAASGDITIVDQIAKVLGASSQTLEEAFLTAVRVRRAEARARELLTERKENNYAAAPKPPPAPMQYEDDTEERAAEDAITTEVIIPDVAPEPVNDSDAAKPKVGLPRRVTR